MGKKIPKLEKLFKKETYFFAILAYERTFLD